MVFHSLEFRDNLLTHLKFSKMKTNLIKFLDFLKNRKVLGYIQFVFTKVCMISVIVWSLGFVTERYKSHVFDFAIMSAISCIGFICLREIKYLKLSNRTDFSESGYPWLLILTTFSILFDKFYFTIFNLPYQYHHYVFFLPIAISAIVSLIHPRWGIVVALTVPLVSLIIWPFSDYLFLFYAYCCITCICFLVKKIFFTKWTSYLKKDDI